MRSCFPRDRPSTASCHIHFQGVCVAESNCASEPRLQMPCKQLQRRNRRTCGGAAKESRAGWYRRRRVLAELPGFQTGLARGAWGGTASPICSTISFGRESSRQLTGFGRETRTVPPSGGVSWAQVHHDRSLHVGNARVPPGSSAIEGSEDGGDRRAASGHERGNPRLRQLLMHLREKRHWSKTWL